MVDQLIVFGEIEQNVENGIIIRSSLHLWVRMNPRSFRLTLNL
jgi:hypothetical protein